MFIRTAILYAVLLKVWHLIEKMMELTKLRKRIKKIHQMENKENRFLHVPLNRLAFLSRHKKDYKDHLHKVV